MPLKPAQGNHSITRRSFVKATAFGAASLGAPYLIRPASAQTVQLTMLAWYGHAEPDVVQEFEKAHNVKFVPKYYTGGDNMLALISQSPPGTYDVILSDAEYVQQLREAGYVEQLDPKDYAFDDFFPEFHRFPGHWVGDKLYSVITRFGFLGVSFNTNAVTEAEAHSYKIFWNDKLKGKVGHFDWHLPNLGQISLYAGNKRPYDIGPDAWKKVQDTTMSLRPSVGGFFDYGGTFASLKNGQMQAFCGIGDWITGVLEKAGAPIRTVIPDEGGLQWTESFCIGKGSKKQDLAKKWIQYITSAQGQAKSADMAAYPALIPNRKGWEILAKEKPEEAKRQRMELGKPNVMDDIRSGKIQFRELPVQQDLETWNDFWTRYKSQKA
jgi:spermidine/putrescine transport system substrate-binding protein